MKKFIILMMVSLALSSSAFLLFSPISVFSDQIGLAISLAIVIIQTLASWFFFRSLGAFKRDLKVAYSFLAVGIFMFGLAQLQLANVTFAIAYPEIINQVFLKPAVNSSLIVGPTILGAFIMYLGARKFARLLEIHNVWSSLLVVTGISLALGVAGVLLPHPDYGISNITLDLIFGPYLASIGFTVAAAIVTWQLKNKLSSTYKPALRWLAVGLIVIAFSAFHETMLKSVIMVYGPSWMNDFFVAYLTYNISLWPNFVAAIALLWAGLLFQGASKKVSKLSDDASYLDVVNYVAQLASSPAAIDVTLDKVREITALQKPDTELSPNNKQELVKVYLELEDYLTTKEPLRKLTKEDLRIRLPDDFQKRLAG